MPEDIKLALGSFKFRFSGRKPRDVQLSHWVKADTDTNGINVSEVCKELLYAWYQQRYFGEGLFLPPVAGASLPGGAPPEGREDPNDPLVQNLLNLSFDESI